MSLALIAVHTQDRKRPHPARQRFDIFWFWLGLVLTGAEPHKHCVPCDSDCSWASWAVCSEGLPRGCFGPTTFLVHYFDLPSNSTLVIPLEVLRHPNRLPSLPPYPAMLPGGAARPATAVTSLCGRVPGVDAGQSQRALAGVDPGDRWSQAQSRECWPGFIRSPPACCSVAVRSWASCPQLLGFCFLLSKCGRVMPPWGSGEQSTRSTRRAARLAARRSLSEARGTVTRHL